MTAPALSLPRPLLWPLLATALVLSWSSGFVGIRYASESAGVGLVLFWRTLISGLILLPFALLIGPRMPLRGVIEQCLFGVLSVFRKRCIRPGIDMDFAPKLAIRLV